MIKKLLLLGILLIIPTIEINAYEYAKNMEDVHRACCRVTCFKRGSNSGSSGSGTVCLLKNNKYWIITNYHVVAGTNDYTLDFFGYGKKVSVKAELAGTWFNENGKADFAILTVPENQLSEYDPPIVPMAGNISPQVGSMIISSGCPNARWASIWKGTIEDYYGSTAQFYPAPKPGQSGSSIVQSINGSLKITAILTWRVGEESHTSEDNMRGGAIPIALFWEAVTGRNKADNSNSIPPNSAWCNDSNIGKDYTYPVQAITRSGSIPNLSYKDVMLYYVMSDDCAICVKARPIIAKLRNAGYPITIINASTEAGYESATKLKISNVPTFILSSKRGVEWYEVERWQGVESLEEKARGYFSKYSISSDMSSTTSNESDNCTDDTCDRATRNKPQQPKTSDNSSNSRGSNNDISPLIDEYFPDNTNNRKPRILPDNNSNNDNTPQIQTGILQRAADAVGEAIKVKLESIIPQVENKLLSHMRAFLCKAILAAFIILLSSYYLPKIAYYALKYIFQHLPTITFNSNISEEEEEEEATTTTTTTKKKRK